MTSIFFQANLFCYDAKIDFLFEVCWMIGVKPQVDWLPHTGRKPMQTYIDLIVVNLNKTLEQKLK